MSAAAVALQGRLSTWKDVQDFIFAGNATFTLVSLKTGVRFTYKVRKRKLNPIGDEVFFLNLLRGPDNENDYMYMGVLRKEPVRYFWTTASGKVGRQAPAYKALVWMVEMARLERGVLGKTLEVWHEGRCGRCGRKLTVPSSVAAGLGPECARKAA